MAEPARSLPPPRYDPARDENRKVLCQRFLERLLDLQPAAVLDVGAGDGQLLAGLRARSVPAVGLVPGAPPEGFPVVRGVAEELPFATGSFDWVALRHVLHHLADPGAGLAEAWRVCRSGLLVAEPWFDPRIPSQGMAQRADRWLRGLQRRAGMVHHDDLDTDAVLALLPEVRRAEVQTAYYLRLRPRQLGDFRHEVEPLLLGLPEDAPERTEYRRLLEQIPLEGLSWPGSAVMVLPKPL